MSTALAFTAAGCAAKPKLQAYAGNVPPEQLAELYVETRVRLISVDGVKYPGVTDDEATEKTRAFDEAQKAAESNAYPRRIVQVPAGEHEFVFGIAKHMLPVKRDTHIAVVLLTGDVSYRSKMYPGSSDAVAVRTTLKPKQVLRVYPRFDRPDGSPETWRLAISDMHSSKPVSMDTRKIAAATPDGTKLGPNDWADAARAKLEEATK